MVQVLERKMLCRAAWLVKTFQELIAWQQARECKRLVYQLSDRVDRGMWKETELEAIRTHVKRAVSAIAKLQEYLNSCAPDFGSPNP